MGVGASTNRGISENVIGITLGDVVDEKQSKELAATGFSPHNLQYIMIARENKRIEYLKSIREDLKKTTHNGNSADESKQILRVIFCNDVYDVLQLPYFRHAKSKYSSPKDGIVDGFPPCDKVYGILAGDFIAPSFLTSLDSGKGMIECLNLAGINLVCFGNHENDIPFKDLKQRIEESKFKWINSNMPNFPMEGLAEKIISNETVIMDAKGSLPARKVLSLGLSI